MASRRWLKRSHWAWDSGHLKKPDSMMRKMVLKSMGNEVVVRKEGSLFNVFARVKK